MRIDLPGRMKPHEVGSPLRRLAVVRELRHGRRGDRVIRVRFPFSRKSYAFVAREPVGVGDDVEVFSAVQHEFVVTQVVGFGRRGYMGPLKRARVLR